MADLMRRIAEVAAGGDGRRVVSVSVRLGALSHLSADHFAEHFARASAGTVAEDAALKLTVCDDIGAVGAGDIVLESVEVED